jgi:hypothetical protein
MQINTCLYLAKGLSEYVAILEIDEFFMPKGKYGNFLDVLNSIPKYDPKTSDHSAVVSIDKKGGIGFADADDHPYCYISVTTEAVYNSRPGPVDPDHPWMGERYVIVYTYIYMSIYIYMCMYVCMYVRMHVCI